MPYMFVLESHPLELHSAGDPCRVHPSVSSLWDQAIPGGAGEFAAATTTKVANAPVFTIAALSRRERGDPQPNYYQYYHHW